MEINLVGSLDTYNMEEKLTLTLQIFPQKNQQLIITILALFMLQIFAVISTDPTQLS